MYKSHILAACFAGMAITAMGQSTTVWPPAGGVDTFEYADNAALDAVYATVDVADGVDGGISTEQNVSATGTKSLKLNTSNDVTGNLTESVVDGTNITLSARFHFFDTAGATATPARHGFTLGSYDGGAWGAGGATNLLILGTYTSLNAGVYCTRVVTGPSAGYAVTTAARTLGWHKMEIRANNGTAEFLVDDAVVSTRGYTTPALGWNSFRLGDFVASTNNITSYFDDVSVVKTVGSSVDEWHMY